LFHKYIHHRVVVCVLKVEKTHIGLMAWSK
jgi:hypothetical protein